MSAGIEIVFVHNASSWHLPFILRQAAHASPATTVTLLSDRPRERAFFKCALSDLESALSRECVRTYRHRSVNSASFELFCYLRWFYLHEYMIRQKLEGVWYVDSDVLVFSSAQEMMEAHPGLRGRCAFLVPAEVPNPAQWPASAHTSYWTPAMLGRFCEFVLRSFVEKPLVDLYEQRWRQVTETGLPGGVSDMTTFYYFWQQHQDAVVNLAVPQGDTVFDWNFNTGLNHRLREYQATSGTKQVLWREGRPWFVPASAPERAVRAHTIHFQGQAKRFIPAFYSGPRFASQPWANTRRGLEVMSRKGKEMVHRFLGT